MKRNLKKLFIYLVIGIPALVLIFLLIPKKEKELERVPSGPKVVNIVNFIRQCEPRIEWITPDVLFETVVEQIALLKAYNLPGTFLLQYDALMEPRYPELLKSLNPDQFEIGAWWEIPQPLVENSGMVWRGRYPWDWHADVGFATGYSPSERELLIDTYMKDFQAIFGYYPKSVGSWFIDAHSLTYLSEKYGIIASCNCKDQIGTDGYTLWGGYWNQAYYPSKKNAYMPAQNPENQIPVPVFRMLGSDPIYQYDNGLGSTVQRVVSLEPVYKLGGGNADWCNWFYKQLVEGASMAFGYTQTGQENSFTWKAMGPGYEIQMPIVSQLQKEGKVRVETLAESGQWFKENFPVTPATSVTVLEDHSDKDLKTVWFNCRYYRANLLWDKGNLRFRDIHIFDESLSSDYLLAKGTSTSCNYYTLPFLDGFVWSTKDSIAGLRFYSGRKGEETELIGGDPVVDDSYKDQLIIDWPLRKPEGSLRIVFSESGITITTSGKELRNLFLELRAFNEQDLPSWELQGQHLRFNYLGHSYWGLMEKGRLRECAGGRPGYQLRSSKGQISLQFGS